MKGFADKPSYIIELLEGGVTLEDVIDGHICEQALVSSAFRLFNSIRLQGERRGCPKMRYITFMTLSLAFSIIAKLSQASLCTQCESSCVPRWRRVRLWWATSAP